MCFVNPFGYGLFDHEARMQKVFGGAEVQLYYLATALAKDPSFSVSMIVEGQKGGVAPEVAGVRMIGVKPIGAGFARLRDRLPMPSPAYLAALRRADAEIYLQRGAAVLTGDVAAYCGLRRQKFAFMAAHDWDCDRSHQRGKHFLAGSYYLAALRSADLVLAQSEAQRDALRAHHGIASLVQPTVYPPDATVENNREHVLWIGRCLDWKRPHAFLDLATRLAGVPFLMACPRYSGAHDLHAQVAQRASQLPNVEFIEFIPFHQTHDLFRRAIALVNTSTAEGFPNTFVQAARAATPVCSLDVNPDGVIETAGMGYCANGSIPLLAEHLGNLVKDAERWQECSRNATAYFRAAHDLDRLLPPFAEALRSLQSTPDRPRRRADLRRRPRRA